jgi:hypothetical protein
MRSHTPHELAKVELSVRTIGAVGPSLLAVVSPGCRCPDRARCPIPELSWTLASVTLYLRISLCLRSTLTWFL